MRPALGYKWVSPLSDWQDIPRGQQLFDSEQNLINEQLKYCFGQYLVKVGALTSQLDTSDCTIKKQINVSAISNRTNRTGIVAEFDELPFLENSIDAIVMNHVLEFCSDPHHVLREAHRSLLPNGNLIISAFNPWSLLSCQKVTFSPQYSEFRKGRFFSIGRIKDWLQLLGFEVTYEQQLYYSGFAQNTQELDSSYIAQLIKSVCPWVGGVCIITAKKREWPLTPVRPRVRYKTMFNPAVRARSANRQTKMSDS